MWFFCSFHGSVVFCHFHLLVFVSLLIWQWRLGSPERGTLSVTVRGKLASSTSWLWHSRRKTAPATATIQLLHHLWATGTHKVWSSAREGSLRAWAPSPGPPFWPEGLFQGPLLLLLPGQEIWKITWSECHWVGPTTKEKAWLSKKNQNHDSAKIKTMTQQKIKVRVRLLGLGLGVMLCHKSVSEI